MKVTLHSQTHEWRGRDEEGQVTINRAAWDTRAWTFEITTKKDPEWHPVAEPTLEMYEALRDVLWRKYQRRRVPWRFVEELDAKILEIQGSSGADAAQIEED